MKIILFKGIEKTELNDHYIDIKVYEPTCNLKIIKLGVTDYCCFLQKWKCRWPEMSLEDVWLPVEYEESASVKILNDIKE